MSTRGRPHPTPRSGPHVRPADRARLRPSPVARPHAVRAASAAALLLLLAPGAAATSLDADRDRLTFEHAGSFADHTFHALVAVARQPGVASDEPTSPAAPRSEPEGADPLDAPLRLRFGQEGTHWWSVQAGYARSISGNDLNARLVFHHFLADRFEINTSLGVWGHDQEGDNEASVNADVGFRWHFAYGGELGDPDAARWLPKGWTVYADTGIGLMYATGDVPTGGTRYNFTPRAGLGLTIPLGETSPRLDLGLRWQHFSNASTSGSDDNPARDETMIYAGLIVRF